MDYGVLTTIHARLTRLHTILFHAPYEQYITTFAQCTFPCLSHFGSYLPITPDVVEFLDRHPTIHRLELVPIVDKSITEIQPIAVPRFSSIRLPNLAKFAGPAYIVPSIFPVSSNVGKVIVYWNEQFAHDLIPVLDALNRISPPLRKILCIRYEWGTELMDSISHHMPDVISISIFSLVAAVRRTWEEEQVRR